MEAAEILEGNKLIAYFMGGIKHDDLLWTLKIKNNDKAYYILQTRFKYHLDWSWLMPVIEKIEEGNFGFKMCRKVVEVYIDDTKEVILKTKEQNRLASLYKAVVEFIKWYNNQKN